MKKMLTVGAMLLVLLLSACSEESQTVSTEKEATTTANKEKTNNAEKPTTQKEEVKKEAKVELVQDTYGAWKNSIDTVWVNYSAEIKNTGNAPASLGDIQINFEGADGTVLGTAEMIMSTPDVLLPGETAYITESTTLDTVTDAALVKKAYANIDFDTTDEKPYYLKTENVKLNATNNEFLDDQPYTVTGSVINDGDTKADDIRLAAGLYDEKGKLVGVLDGSIDVALNKNGKAAFELNYPSLSSSVKGKVKTVKVVAYNWDMGF